MAKLTFLLLLTALAVVVGIVFFELGELKLAPAVDNEPVEHHHEAHIHDHHHDHDHQHEHDGHDHDHEEPDILINPTPIRHDCTFNFLLNHV